MHSSASRVRTDRFFGTVDGAVLTEPPIIGDVPFSPEVYFDGEYRPICFANLNDGVESVGNAFCLAAGFNGGARVVQNKQKTHKRDAIPVSCHECCFSLLLGIVKNERLEVVMISLSILSSPPRASSQMIKIAKCDPGQSLLSCLNAQYRRDEDILDACKAGNAVGVEIACNFQV